MIFFLRKANLVFVAVLCSAMFSCNLEFWKEPPIVLAEVESTRLYIDELREMVCCDDTISREEWVRRIELWVDLEIMYREALKKGLHKDPVTQKLIKNAEKKILADRLMLTMDSTFSINSDKELQEFYDNNMELFRLDTPDSLGSLDSLGASDSVSYYIPFSEAMPQIRSAVLSEKRIKREKKWLAETKNHYAIEVYPQYLDSL